MLTRILIYSSLGCSNTVLSRVAEPENLKTVPVPTFYLNTVPVPVPVPAPDPGHVHTYTVHLRIRIHLCVHILIQYIYIYVQIPILRTVHACTYTCTNTYT
jgi:hypothetical protein